MWITHEIGVDVDKSRSQLETYFMINLRFPETARDGPSNLQNVFLLYKIINFLGVRR